MKAIPMLIILGLSSADFAKVEGSCSKNNNVSGYYYAYNSIVNTTVYYCYNFSYNIDNYCEKKELGKSLGKGDIFPEHIIGDCVSRIHNTHYFTVKQLKTKFLVRTNEQMVNVIIIICEAMARIDIKKGLISLPTNTTCTYSKHDCRDPILSDTPYVFWRNESLCSDFEQIERLNLDQAISKLDKNQTTSKRKIFQTTSKFEMVHTTPNLEMDHTTSKLDIDQTKSIVKMTQTASKSENIHGLNSRNYKKRTKTTKSPNSLKRTKGSKHQKPPHQTITKLEKTQTTSKLGMDQTTPRLETAQTTSNPEMDETMAKPELSQLISKLEMTQITQEQTVADLQRSLFYLTVFVSLCILMALIIFLFNIWVNFKSIKRARGNQTVGNKKCFLRCLCQSMTLQYLAFREEDETKSTLPLNQQMYETVENELYRL